MSIQGAINQGITIASVLASQSPSYKDAVEKRINVREINKGEAKYQDLEKQVNALNEELKDAQMPADVAAGKEQQIKEIKAKQDIINQDLLKRGSDKALDRVGAEAARAEANAPVTFTNEANEAFERMREANRQALRRKAAKQQQSEFVQQYIKYPNAGESLEKELGSRRM